jgi:hypothetical protein
MCMATPTTQVLRLSGQTLGYPENIICRAVIGLIALLILYSHYKGYK